MSIRTPHRASLRGTAAARQREFSRGSSTDATASRKADRGGSQASGRPDSRFEAPAELGQPSAKRIVEEGLRLAGIALALVIALQPQVLAWAVLRLSEVLR